MPRPGDMVSFVLNPGTQLEDRGVLIEKATGLRSQAKAIMTSSRRIRR